MIRTKQLFCQAHTSYTILVLGTKNVNISATLLQLMPCYSLNENLIYILDISIESVARLPIFLSYFILLKLWACNLRISMVDICDTSRGHFVYATFNIFYQYNIVDSNDAAKCFSEREYSVECVQTLYPQINKVLMINKKEVSCLRHLDLQLTLATDKILLNGCDY